MIKCNWQVASTHDHVPKLMNQMKKAGMPKTLDNYLNISEHHEDVDDPRKQATVKLSDGKFNLNIKPCI